MRSLEFDLLIFQKKSTKDGDLIHDEYIWKKITFVTKFEKWEIYFKNEVIGDFAYEILGKEWKWYKKGYSINFFDFSKILE